MEKHPYLERINYNLPKDFLREAAIACSLGSGLRASSEQAAAPGCGDTAPLSSSATRRRSRRIAEEEGLFGSRTWGYTSLAVARWFTPGYMLPPLRG